MKKIIISLFIVATLLSPFSVSAATSQEVTNQLIALLQQTIVMLQQQIADLIAEKTQTSSEVVAQAQDIQSNIQSESLTPIQYDSYNMASGAAAVVIPPAVTIPHAPVEPKQECTPTWTCSNWSSCTNNSHTRRCNGLSTCGFNYDKLILNKPSEVESCAPILGCTIRKSKNYNHSAEKDDGSCIPFDKLTATCVPITNSVECKVGNTISWRVTANGDNGWYMYLFAQNSGAWPTGDYINSNTFDFNITIPSTFDCNQKEYRYSGMVGSSSEFIQVPCGPIALYTNP